jgi:ATP-dependent exoDNAse (exonuclease V) beta subunit
MIDNVVSSEGLDLEDAVLTQKVVNMYDTIKSLETLSVGLNTSEELIAKIEAIITDDERDGVCLSTIHKAKGLEADNVFVACDSLLPSKFAKKAWEIEVEDNLRYVMITRAKKTLNFISEKEFPPGALSLDAETFIEELEMIKVEVERAIHGKESDVTLAKKYAYTNEDITTDVSRILNKKVAGTRVTNGRRKNNVGGNRMSKFLK